MRKFISIHKLVERKQEIKNVKIQRETTEKVMSINHIDIKPLLPGANDNIDNQKIINHFFNEKLNESSIILKEPIAFYLKIDSLGKGHIHKIYSNDSIIINFVRKHIEELPSFTPGVRNRQKVSVMTSYEIGRQ